MPMVAGRFARAAIRLATDMGFGLMLAWGYDDQGWATAGRATRATARRPSRGDRGGTSNWVRPVPALPPGHGGRRIAGGGRIGHGRAAAAEALAIAQRTGERFYEAELLRTTGELILAAGADRPKADEAFRSAVRVARDQGASMLTLRSAIRLARGTDATDRPARLDLLREALRALPADSPLPERAEADALLAE